MIYLLCFLPALALLALDQWLKAWITANLPLGETQAFLPGFIEFQTVHNYGCWWGSPA